MFPVYPQDVPQIKSIILSPTFILDSSIWSKLTSAGQGRNTERMPDVAHSLPSSICESVLLEVLH